MCKQRWFAYRGCAHQNPASPIEPCGSPAYQEDVIMAQEHTWDVDLQIKDGKCPHCTMGVFGWEDEAMNCFSLEAARLAMTAGLDSAINASGSLSPPNFDFPIPEFGALNLDPPTPLESPPGTPLGQGLGPFGFALPHPGSPVAAPLPPPVISATPLFQLHGPPGMVMPTPFALPPGTVLPPLGPGAVYGPPGFMAGPLPPGVFLGPPPGMIFNSPPPGLIKDPITYTYIVPPKP
ncbi:uncharacterized protein BDZ99DRAFT_464106 [Mytilinidion resinicola]|uniref:Uncharacterized protein n=1 Tax=Mytilinidion resinicola TaxID=574789 RepID=A0A6A6YHB7_9PEZI|nr:uncharacterized protein BDZ99DRAFT_464106 [Mytilinidion resinicola]KAF2808212.1 hypothetical protein BDZ99DRAFT_464106 [Mytilinidion resinicola]